MSATTRQKKPHFFYMEVHNTYLVLSTATQESDHVTFISQTTRIIPLSNLEFEKGILYNPTFLLEKIVAFLKDNKEVQNVYIAYSESMMLKKTHVALLPLQLSLVAARANCKVVRVITSNPIAAHLASPSKPFSCSMREFTSKKNYFAALIPPKNTSPKRWLKASLSIYLALICSMTLFSGYTYSHRRALKQEIERLKTNTALLEKNTIDIASLTEEQEQSYPLSVVQSLLTSLAQYLPARAHLTTFRLLAQSNGEKQHRFKLSGDSYAQEHLPPFIETLAHCKHVAGATLAQLSKSAKHQGRYTFAIDGTLKA